ncbi:MAG: cation:proton antiporter [Lachnospiraceae bacterium]
MDYDFLLYLAIILLSTKLLGLLTRRFHLPQVVGALLAGLILGPACLDLLKETDFIKQLAEIGVIVLMYMAGLESDINELKKSGKASFVIALIGVLVPLIGGFAIAEVFHVGDSSLPTSAVLQNIFIGIILTATSVSITVETLKELGKLSTPAGTAILGAAVIDDILGIIALTIVTSMADGKTSVGLVLIKIVLFFAFALVFSFGFEKLSQLEAKHWPKKLQRDVILSFAFCLSLSYCAEKFFGVADITGAFIAGVATSMSPKREYINERFGHLSYMLVAPVFFASIGLNVVIPKMSSSIIIFTLLLLILAIITKVVGCGLGARFCHYSTSESLQIGVGMISRGEVALIVANKGASVGLMSDLYFGPIVIMVIITTILTPILLKVVFREQASKSKT